jgi:hypothetical protein
MDRNENLLVADSGMRVRDLRGAAQLRLLGNDLRPRTG